MKKKILAFLILCIVMVQTVGVFAVAPYSTLTEDYRGRLVASKTGYLPERTITQTSEETFNQASDIFIDDNDTLYILDTGNARVLVSTTTGSWIRTVGEGQLAAPTGLYVNDDGDIYVADPELGQVLIFSPEGELIETFERPTEPLFGASNTFAPSKLVVDNAGSIYVISQGNTNGLAQISAYGEFLGYFGANYTRLPFTEILRRILFTDAQRDQLRLVVPSSPRNVAIDHQGLIHTVTQGAGDQGLKKFNMAGVNMLDQGAVDNQVSDVATGHIENIYALSTAGYIYEYTREGDLLFLFGGGDDGRNRAGLFISAMAIDVDSQGNLYVLDQEMNKVEVFSRTEYARTVHEALDLYQDGKYIESKEPWENVLRENSLFDYAYRGTGQAFYKMEDYEASMEAFRLGGEKPGYSDSFWEVRNIWLKDHLVYILIAIVSLVILRRILRVLDRKFGIYEPVRRLKMGIRKNRHVREVGFITQVPKNPADAYYGIRKQGKVSILSSTILYILFFIIFVINRYFSGFLYKTVPDGYFNILSDLGRVFGLIVLFIVCHNLISSIREGEGRIRDVYNGLAYALMPYYILKPIIFILTFVLTYNEAFIITVLNGFMVLAILVLIFLMVKEIQNYTLSETVINLLLTMFTMIIFILTGIIILSLLSQVWDFLTAVVKEVGYRVQ